MIPIGDDLVTTRKPVVTLGLLLAIALAWVLVQGAGFDPGALAASVCNLGMVAGELTHLAPLGTAIPLEHGWACVVDAEPVNVLTPLTSMFLHGSWAHILGNALFLWVFGKNVEDTMGRSRFLGFYLLCGLVAAAAQVVSDPSSPVPMVGASGAISGVMGAYLVFHPVRRVKMLFIFIVFFKVFRIPAWIVLLYWFGLQVLSALPQLTGESEAQSSGVAVMAHIAGFIAGALLARPFAARALRERASLGSW